VFDAHGGADFIEGVLATGLPVFCCEAVGELRTVVGWHFDDPDRRGQLEPAQRSTLLLSVSSARHGVMGRGHTARARSRRWTRQRRDHTSEVWQDTQALTRSIRFSSSENHGSGESKLLLPIHRPVIMPSYGSGAPSKLKVQRHLLFLRASGNEIVFTELIDSKSLLKNFLASLFYVLAISPLADLQRAYDACS
jgi:hypothetical protein